MGLREKTYYNNSLNRLFQYVEENFTQANTTLNMRLISKWDGWIEERISTLNVALVELDQPGTTCAALLALGVPGGEAGLLNNTGWRAW